MTPRKFYEAVDPHEHGGGEPERGWTINTTPPVGGKERTAVQTILEKLHSLDEQSFGNWMSWNATELLELERTQHYDTFVAGDKRGIGEIPFNAEQYFEQKYQQQ